MNLLLTILLCVVDDDISQHEKECRDAYEKVTNDGDRNSKDLQAAREYFKEYLPYQGSDKYQ